MTKPKRNYPWAERRKLAERVAEECADHPIGEFGHRAVPCYFQDNHPDGFAHRGHNVWGCVHRMTRKDRKHLYAWATFPNLEICLLDNDGPLVAENMVLACNACVRRRTKPTYGKRDVDQ